MSAPNVILVLAAAFLAVFLESYTVAPRRLLGAQVDLLPPLMVYVGLTGGTSVIALAAVWSGLWFDVLSVNPLGTSIVPLFAIGWIVFENRNSVLKEHPFAQFVLGFLASAVAPFLSLIVLHGLGQRPLVGWGSVWQWGVLAFGGAAATPALFWMFGGLNRAFSHPQMVDTTFRADREIKRGKD